jgi:metal-responsive CopG/Arc/MetJ family transcriptional regulator
MQKKEKIAITIDKQILAQIDNKVDKINFKNRSHVIENFLRE